MVYRWRLTGPYPPRAYLVSASDRP